jgi:outer membrane protein assembly factor BamB
MTRAALGSLLLLAGCSCGDVELAADAHDLDATAAADGSAPDAEATDAAPPDAVSGSAIWLTPIGGAGCDQARALAIDAGGDLVIAGRFEGTMTVGGTELTSAGMADIFVAALDPGGVPLWARRFGGAGQDLASGLAATAGRLFLTGSFTDAIDLGGGPITSAGGSDVLVLGLSPADGALLWSRHSGGPGDDLGGAVAADGLGNLFVTGSDAGAAFVASYDPDGGDRWATTFGSGGSAAGVAIAAVSGGALVVGAEFTGSLDFGTGPLTSAGGRDLLLVRYAGGTGAVIWVRAFGSPGDDRMGGVALDPVAGAALAAAAAGPIDLGGGELAYPGGTSAAATALLDVDGGHRWSRLDGPAGGLAAAAAVAIRGGAVLVGGRFSGSLDLGAASLTAAGGEDGYLVAHDAADGAPLWSAQLAGTGDDAVAAVSAAAGVHVAGSFTDGATLGGLELTGAGCTDGFAAQLGP